MSKRLPQLLVAMVALFGLLAVVIAIRSTGANKATSAHTGTTVSGAGPGSAAVPDTEALSPTEKAERTAKQFLDRYVGGDGRVRRDPDGDTVSEGQAYAMLLAVAIGDSTRFALVWNWTRANLLDPNGSLAWHWVNGVVVDHNAATDADVDTGRALLMAAQRFGTPSYRADGLAIAAALLSQEVVQGGGGPVLVAGPWATEAPYTVNPSYLSPVAFDALAAASGDARWTSVREAGTELLTSVTNGGSALPPDWAVVDSGGSSRPSAAPDGAPVAYSYDAFRALPRLAEACDTESRQLAAALWAPVARTIADRAATSNLDGSAQTAGDNPLFLIGAAASAHAAGNPSKSAALLDEAQRVYDKSPSYYLGAWVAMARVLIDTQLLGGCALSPADHPTH